MMWLICTAAVSGARLIPREDRKLRKVALTLAAFGLAAAPLAAQSDTDIDTGADTTAEGTGVSAAPIIGFALAAIALGIFVSGDDEPVSA
jgi:hypothetical protein